MKKLRNAVILGMLASPLIGQAQFKFGAEVRPRVEARNGYQALTDSSNNEAAVYVQQRTRLNAGYNSKWAEIFVSVQDIRVWGSTPQLNTTDGFTSLHQGWLKAKFHKNVGLKIGRMEIAYDDHRIFGNVEWAQQARSHDAAVLYYQDTAMSIHIGGAYNQMGVNNRSTFFATTNPYKTMQYLWFHRDISNFGVSVLFLNNGLQWSSLDSLGNIADKGVRFSQTAGTRLTYQSKVVQPAVAFYYQFGKTASNAEIAAFNLKASIGVKPVDGFGMEYGFEMISGTSTTDFTNTVNRSFNPLYGTNHAHNGHMDYFYVGNHGGNVGLMDPYAKFSYKYRSFIAAAHVHTFLTGTEMLDAAEFNNTGLIRALSSYLGTELDLILKYTLGKSVAFQLGYSQMFGSNTMEALKGGQKENISNWGYLMITYKPTIFDSSKYQLKKKED